MKYLNLICVSLPLVGESASAATAASEYTDGAIIDSRGEIPIAKRAAETKYSGLIYIYDMTYVYDKTIELIDKEGSRREILEAFWKSPYLNVTYCVHLQIGT